MKAQADCEQMKLLKERQTQERIVMFSELAKSMDEKDQMRVYLDKSMVEAQRDLDTFKRHAEKEKQAKI